MVSCGLDHCTVLDRAVTGIITRTVSKPDVVFLTLSCTAYFCHWIVFPPGHSMRRRGYLRVLWVEDVACPKTHANELEEKANQHLSYPCVFDVSFDAMEALQSMNRAEYDAVFLCNNIHGFDFVAEDHGHCVRGDLSVEKIVRKMHVRCPVHIIVKAGDEGYTQGLIARAGPDVYIHKPEVLGYYPQLLAPLCPRGQQATAVRLSGPAHQMEGLPSELPSTHAWTNEIAHPRGSSGALSGGGGGPHRASASPPGS